MRPHSQSLKDALTNGIRAAGMDVIDVGMCDTSFGYFAVNHLACAGCVQVTASHNPVRYNGFKISGPQAKPIGQVSGLNDVKAFTESAPEANSVEPKGQYEEQDLWSDYRDHIQKFLHPLKKPFKVVVDASNGMAGKLVPAAFDGVENLEIIPVNFEITGSFVHEPNPLVAENMKPTQEAVLQHKADLGACFDGDADRCILVDDKGNIISCDHLTALLASSFFIRQHVGTTIVYDLRSSKVTQEMIEAYGGKPKKSRVGHVFMKAALRESGGAFGGELSGHFYFKGNFYADSGAITLASVLTVLNKEGKPFSELMEPLRNKYSHSGEINFEVEDKQGVLQQLKDTYNGPDYKVDELDGVSVDAFETKGWWFNVRPSNTEPLLRMNAEAQDFETLQALLEEIRPMLGTEASGH
jgi:phosphomannomutase